MITTVNQNTLQWGSRLLGKQTYPLPQKAEVPAPPLDTSLQASVEKMETSLQSNPINAFILPQLHSRAAIVTVQW